MSFANYDELASNSTANSAPNVGYFNLKNDGDCAYVRLPYETTADFEVVPTHLLKVNGLNFNPRVACLRKNRYDAAENCPICSRGGKFSISFGPANSKEVDSSKVEYKLYVRMLVYTRNATTGKFDVQAQTWERPWKFGDELKSKIDDYGPMKSCVYKVKRLGSGTDTRYELNIVPKDTWNRFVSPEVYNSICQTPGEEVFPSSWNLFDGFNVVGNRVWEKNFAELSEFASTGSFPLKAQTAQTVQTVQQQQVQQQAQSTLSVSSAPLDATSRHFEFGANGNTVDLPFDDVPVTPTTQPRERMPWDEL